MKPRFTDEELTSWGKSDAFYLKDFILEGNKLGHRTTVKLGINTALRMGKQVRGLHVGREQIMYREAFDLAIDEILNSAGIGGRSFWSN